MTHPDDREAVLEILAALATHRREVGLSRGEVARRMGTTRMQVARLESGIFRPRLEMRTLQRYARAVEAPLQFVVTLTIG